MTRSWWHQMRHRFIILVGSLAMLMVASGLHLKPPSANLDSNLDTAGSHHAIHNMELQKIKDRIQRRLLGPKKDLQEPKSQSSISSS